MSPKEKTFTSNEVSTLTGVTLRQLQWWDEKKIIRPVHENHKRLYTKTQATQVIVVSALRKRGLSLRATRQVLRAVRASVVDLQEDYYMLVRAKLTVSFGLLSQVVEIAAKETAPVVILDLRALRAPLNQELPKREPRSYERRPALGAAVGYTRVDMSQY